MWGGKNMFLTRMVTVASVAAMLLGVQPLNAAPPTHDQCDKFETEVEKFLSKHLAQGNKGRAEMEVIKYNKEDGSLYVKLEILHWHRVRGIDVYKVRQHVDFTFNPDKPQTLKDAKLCLDLPPIVARVTGKRDVCVTLGELIEIAAAIFGG
jgi:hypothetical protein